MDCDHEVSWFDSHCHLYDESDPVTIIRDAVDQNVRGFIVVGTDLVTSLKSYEIAKSVRDEVEEITLGLAVGVHPHSASEGIEGLEELIATIQSESTNLLVGVGECGFDFYYNNSPKADQERVFRCQIELAASLDLALIVHTRDAWHETFDVLDRFGSNCRVLIHCFTGSVKELSECIERGFTVSFSGIATFPKAEEIHEAVRRSCDGQFLIETDSPFLAPVPLRGKKNSPKNVAIVGREIARLRDESELHLAQSTRNAALSMFRFAPK